MKQSAVEPRFSTDSLCLSLTIYSIRLTVSILRLLCSHLILIPDLLHSTSVAIAVYFKGNPFTIGNRCYNSVCSSVQAGRHVRDVGKALLKQNR